MVILGTDCSRNARDWARDSESYYLQTEDPEPIRGALLNDK